MHVLMISLEDTIAAQPDGETRARHERYAEAAGHLTVITFRRTPGVTDGDLSPHLAVYRCGGSRVLFTLRAVWLGLRRARRPVDLVTTQDPFTTGLAGVLLAWLLRAPLLVQNHSAFFDNPYWLAENPLRNRLFNWLGKWVVKRGTMHRLVNEAERAKYLAWGIPPERVRVIPLANPAPFAAPQPPAALAAQRAAWGLDESHHVVLWVGRPVATKGLPRLLKAMQLVAQADSQARLVLVGDFDQAADDLPGLIDKLGLSARVIQPGPCPHADLPRIYQAADVFALTSHYEGLPRVLSEAGAAGLPQVIMDLPGLSEAVVDGQNGYVVAQDDVGEFAGRLLMLLTNRTLAAQLSAQARTLTLTRFDPDTLFEAWLACWRDAAAAGSR